MDAASVIAHYVMDGDQPLTANSAGNTTFYLYGLDAIAEKTTAWSYSLPDGTNTPRQLSNPTGGITLLARYTPWGDTLDTYGNGDFTFGYFGGVMDAATGLVYVGNGQYYDPATGRFLTRDAKPNNSNPYVPWDPTGAIVGPLAAIAAFFGRKKKGSKAGTFLVLLLVLGSVGMTLAACGSGPIEVTAVITPDGTATITFGPITVVTTVAAATEAANIDVTKIPCLTPLENVPPPTGTPIPTTPGGGSNPQTMKTSPEAVNFILYWEGPWKQQPYNDLGENCTIGYGHLLLNDKCTGAIKKYYLANPLSQSGADDFLHSDIRNAEEDVRSITVNITQAQFDALVSYIFNSGGESNQPFHTKKIPELINSGNFEAAAEAIESGPITSGGKESDKLKERRHAEAYLFLNGIYLVP